MLYLSSNPGLSQFPLLNLKADLPRKQNKRRAIVLTADINTARSEIHSKREAMLAMTANVLQASGNFDSTILLGEQATKQRLLDLLSKINQEASPGDTLLLYLSGLTVDAGDGVMRMFLADANLSSPESALSGPELAKVVRQGKSTNNILVLDADSASSYVGYFEV